MVASNTTSIRCCARTSAKPRRWSWPDGRESWEAIDSGITVKIEGVEDLKQAIAALGKQAERAEAEALKAGAEVIRRDASQKAPRSRRSAAHLADNIVIGGIKKQGGVRMIEIGLAGGSEKGPFYYGRYQELGTKKMRAQPYLAPAADAKAENASQKIAQTLKGELNL